MLLSIYFQVIYCFDLPLLMLVGCMVRDYLLVIVFWKVIADSLYYYLVENISLSSAYAGVVLVKD